jgi:hypothetical protein
LRNSDRCGADGEGNDTNKIGESHCTPLKR